jgi:tetratricopeptide (TPR) repeat protein/transglutaminase-like putative cysteine protease
MRTTLSFRRLVAVLAPLGALWAAAPTSAVPADGGQPLWGSMAAARAAAAAALHQDSSDIAARLALGRLAEEQDDTVGALQAWRPLYHLSPGHWSATALWPEMVRLTEASGRWDLLTAAARDVLAAPTAPAPLRASARLALAHQALRTGDGGTADHLWAGLGYVRAWKVIGPFDNVSKSGFDKAWPPEQAMDFQHSCVGKDGQNLQWHTLALLGRGGECAVGSSLSDRDPDVFYAATSLYSAREQPVTLQVNTTGASKLFLRGRLVFSDPVYRPAPDLVADVFPVAVTLHAGWNTVLLKLADDEHLTSSFRLRVTTPSGADLPPMKADPDHAVLTTLDAGQTLPPAAKTATETLLRRQGADNLDASDALVSELKSTGDDAEAVTVARANLACVPNSPWLHWQLGQALQSDDQIDEARAERDAACQADPKLLLAALDAVDDQSESLAPAEYVRQLKALLAARPGSASVLWDLADAYDTVKLSSEALRTARAAEQAAPGTTAVLHLAHFLRDHDRDAEALHVLTAALTAAPNDFDLLDQKASLLVDQGDASVAIAAYQRLLTQELPDPTDRATLAGLYEAQQDLASADRVLSVARLQRPQDSEVCSSLADVARGLGHKKEALDLLAAAISLDPSAVALREERQVLIGEKPVIDLAPPTPGQPLIDQARKSGGQGASAVVLLDEGREVVSPDYATVVRYHKITRIGDAAAVTRFSNYPLSRPTLSSDVTLESARLIKANGKVEDMADKYDDDQQAVAFPSLAPGDTIDVSYRVEDYARGGLAHQFWANWLFSDTETPVKLSRFVLITPAGMTFQTQAHGATPAPTERDSGGWHIREWRTADVPAFKGAQLGSSVLDNGAWLDISSISSWSDVVRWYRALSGPRCLPDEAIRAKALDLTQGLNTDTEKLRAIVTYVRGLQYQSTPFRLSAYVPTEGKQVIREQYGDCKDKAALLTALLSAVGIQSDMVLLSPREHGVTPFLPSPRFNHAIARVQTVQGPLWVDATADQMAFGGFPAEDQQVPALVIDDATTDLTTTPLLAPERNTLDNTFQGTLTSDGTLHGSLEMVADGNWGWLFHTIFKEVPQDKRDEALRGYATEAAKGAVYEGGGLEDDADPDKPFSLHVKYHQDGYSAATDNFLLLRLPWGSGEEAAALETLKQETPEGQDLDLASLRGRYVSKVSLQLPAGFMPQNLQPEKKADSPFGFYDVTYHMDGGTLSAECDMTFTQMRVAAKDVSQFMAFLQALDQETGRQMVFKK